MGDPLDLLPGDGALGTARPLLGVLVHKLPTWGLHDLGLIGFCRVAVTTLCVWVFGQIRPRGDLTSVEP